MFQAKLAPDLVDLLEHHEQPIDPNLLMLANAFQTADQVLKELESKEGDESDPLEEILSDSGGKNDSPEVMETPGNSYQHSWTELTSSCIVH